MVTVVFWDVTILQTVWSNATPGGSAAVYVSMTRLLLANSKVFTKWRMST